MAQPARISFSRILLQMHQINTKKTLETILISISILGIWFIAKPYAGLVHDSILYTAQALHRLDHEIFANDVFFQNQSQDDYTLFPIIHSFILSKTQDPNLAGLIITTAGKALWVGAILALTRCLLPLRWAAAASIFISISPLSYDGDSIFFSGESFATPRIFAEALCITAISFWLKKRHLASIITTLTSLLIHPLITLPVISAQVISTFTTKTKSNAPYLLTIISAFTGILYLITLHKQIDPEWMALLKNRSNYLFLDTWHDNWIAKTIFIILSANFLAKKHEILSINQKYSLPVLAAISYIGSCFIHDVFITQIQPWRAYWIAQIISIICVFHRIYFNTVKTKKTFIWENIALFTSLILPPAVGLFLLAIIILTPHLGKNPLFPPISKLITCTALCAAILIEIDQVRIQILFPHQEKPLALTPLQSPTLSMLILAGITWFISSDNPKKTIIGIITALLTFLTGCIIWKNSAQQITAKKNQPDPDVIALIKTSIPKNSTVYWPGRQYDTWITLHRSFYASRTQGAGWVFSRETAIETSKRQQKLLELGFPDGVIQLYPKPEDIPTPPPISKSLIDKMCKLENIDYLILNTEINDRAIMIFKTRSGVKHSVYRCNQ